MIIKVWYRKKGKFRTKEVDMTDVMASKKKQKYGFSKEAIGKKLGIRSTQVGKFEIISENHLTKD